MRGNSEIKKIIRVYLADSKKLENLKDIHEFKIFLLNFFHSFAHQSKILLFTPPIPPAFHSHTTPHYLPHKKARPLMGRHSQ